jgi:hypothetical protein
MPLWIDRYLRLMWSDAQSRELSLTGQPTSCEGTLIEFIRNDDMPKKMKNERWN